jgi:glycosyltransferase involved in cell wall biosynthesis
MRILSPIATGSGAIVVHRALERHLAGYRVQAYSPWWTLFPPALYAVARGDADLIHTVPDYAVFSMRREVPAVVTFHNYVLDNFMRDYSSPLQWLHYRTDLRLFTKRALARARCVTAVSRFVADLVARDLDFRGNIRVIPNGVDTKTFMPGRSAAGRSTIRVLFGGNLSRRKGADLLPAIAKRLPAGIELWCATGLRGEKPAVTRDHLKMVGRVPYADMPSLYNEVDILLMPTAREGFGLVVAEAMACGLPVVASNISTMPELVHEGQGGILCSLDDPSGFADAIERIAAAPELRRAMGEYNRARIERVYTLERMVQAYRTLFEEVLESRGTQIRR